MSISLWDSAFFRDMVSTPPMRAVFSDEARIRAWLEVLGAQAEIQGSAGLIPADCARQITAAARGLHLDPAELAEEASLVGRPILPLVRRLSAACSDEAGKWVHYHGTTQDILDTGAALQQSRAMALVRGALARLTSALCELAEAHATTPMAGRTNGRQARPVTFGFKAAGWASELDRADARLAEVSARAICGQFGGAVGSFVPPAPGGPSERAALMRTLGLPAPDIAWQAARGARAKCSSGVPRVCEARMVKKRQRSEGEAVYPDVAEQRDLIVLLERLNFTEIEAKAYLALFSKSPATAYQIAQLTGLPRPNVYNAVGGLIAKGALQQVSENPVRYIPREPRDFFETVSRSTSELCDDVVNGLQELKIHDQTEFVSNYNGQAAVEVQVRRLIDAARARVYIKSASRLLAPFEDSLVEAANRGVFIYIVAADPGISDLPQHDRIVVIPHEGTGVATGKAVHHLLTITADAEGALIVAFNGYPAASFTRNDAIVYTVHTMILHEIYLAKIHEAFGSELESRFGANLAELRRVYRPENLETQVLARGSHEKKV